MPQGIVTTGWDPVEAKCREFGDEFDEWQRDAGRHILGKRADGIYAATVGGVTMSIPRQVAKTFLVGRIVVALCLLFPGLRVMWTAHRTRTATNTFRSLVGYTKRRKLAAHMLPERTTNGEQEIRFRNGSTIMFGAREQGFGRGFDEVDVEVFDEAQILTEKALEDMVAATNQSRHPHGALLFYMGTPPRPVDPGEAFTQRRTEALAGKSEDAVYIECSADPDADLDDRDQWRKANPSFPNRTPLRSMLRLRKNLPSDDAWRREALGIWDQAGVSHIVDPAAWRKLATDSSPHPTMLAYALDATPTVSHASIGVAVSSDPGSVHVEVAMHDPVSHGWGWVVEWFKARRKTPVVIQAQSPARAMLPDLKRAGVTVILLSTADTAGACTAFIQRVQSSLLTHPDSDLLNTAVAGATTRRYNAEGGVLFDRRDDSVDISPLYAVSLAAQQLSTKRPPRKRVIKRLK